MRRLVIEIAFSGWGKANWCSINKRELFLLGPYGVLNAISVYETTLNVVETGARNTKCLRQANLCSPTCSDILSGTNLLGICSFQGRICDIFTAYFIFKERHDIFKTDSVGRYFTKYFHCHISIKVAMVHECDSLHSKIPLISSICPVFDNKTWGCIQSYLCKLGNVGWDG